MNPDAGLLFSVCAVAALLLLITGLYYVMVTRNLIRVLIGLEIMTKGVTLLIVTAGYVTGRTGLAQALVITLVVLEVVVLAVAAGIVLGVYRHHQSIDTRVLRNLKG